MTEIERIKKIINDMSMEEFDDVLYNCGIESIKPSIESGYVKSLKTSLNECEYRKEVRKYVVKDDMYNYYSGADLWKVERNNLERMSNIYLISGML